MSGMLRHGGGLSTVEKLKNWVGYLHTSDLKIGVDHYYFKMWFNISSYNVDISLSIKSNLP